MLLTTSYKAYPATIAGSATPVGPLLLNHAKRWHLLVKNVHASQTLTACRIRRRAVKDGAQSPWETVTLAAPVAAGESLSIRETDDCSYDVELELTASGAGTGVEIDLGGLTVALIVNGASQATVTPSANSVTTGTIVDGAVGANDLASNSVSTAKIQDAAVTLAKQANLATDTVIGRTSSGTGVPEAVPFNDTLQAMGAAATQALTRTALGLGSLATQDGAFSGVSSGINTGDQTLAGLNGQPRTGLVAVLPFGPGEHTGDETLSVVGRLRFDPADYAIATLTTALVLQLVGDVSGGTCTVTLHNVTDATDDADVSITETDPTVKTDTVALPAAAKTYELRAQLTTGAAPDYWTVGGAVLRVSRS